MLNKVVKEELSKVEETLATMKHELLKYICSKELYMLRV